MVCSELSSLAIVAIAAVASCALVAASQATMPVVSANIFYGNATACDGLVSVVPFGIGNACNQWTSSSSWLVNCSSNSRLVYSSNNCTGVSTNVPFECSLGVLVDDAVIESPSVRFSCGSMPKSRMVILTFGGQCPSTTTRRQDLPDVEYSYALETNICSRLPHGVYADEKTLVGEGFYKLSVKANGTIIYNRYLTNDCSGFAFTTLSGTINQCTPVEDQGGRRLQYAVSNGVVFETIDSSVTLDVESRASAVQAGVVTLVTLLLVYFGSS